MCSVRVRVRVRQKFSMLILLVFDGSVGFLWLTTAGAGGYHMSQPTNNISGLRLVVLIPPQRLVLDGC